MRIEIKCVRKRKSTIHSHLKIIYHTEKLVDFLLLGYKHRWLSRMEIVQEWYQIFNPHISIFRAKIRSIIIIQKMLLEGEKVVRDNTLP